MCARPGHQRGEACEPVLRREDHVGRAIPEGESEAVRLESKLSMIRFAVWSIPAIGFVGTVRGLGEALQRTGFASVSGKPSAVTEGLGVSFNSTFVALTLTIFVMFALHELQLAHDSLSLDAEAYAENNWSRHWCRPARARAACDSGSGATGRQVDLDARPASFERSR